MNPELEQKDEDGTSWELHRVFAEAMYVQSEFMPESTPKVGRTIPYCPSKERPREWEQLMEEYQDGGSFLGIGLWTSLPFWYE